MDCAMPSIPTRRAEPVKCCRRRRLPDVSSVNCEETNKGEPMNTQPSHVGCRSRLALLALPLIAALVLAACAAPAGAPASGGEGGAAATPSQAILIIPEEPASLNQYHAVAAIVRQVADAVSAPLAVPNEAGEFVPVLA